MSLIFFLNKFVWYDDNNIKFNKNLNLYNRMGNKKSTPNKSLFAWRGYMNKKSFVPIGNLFYFFGRTIKKRFTRRSLKNGVTVPIDLKKKVMFENVVRNFELYVYYYIYK